MNKIKVTSLLVLLFGASISNIASASQCTLTNQAITLTPENAYSGDEISLSYSAERESCAGVGSYAHKVHIGSSSGVQLGVCEGSRTAALETCTGVFSLPQDFVGEMNVFVNGAVNKIRVVSKVKAPVAEHVSRKTAEDTPLEIDFSTGEYAAARIEISSQPDDKHGSAIVDGSKIIFRPVTNWNGVTNFNYRLTDANGVQSDSGLIEIEVEPAPDAPILLPATILGNEDAQATYTPKVIDADIGDTYTLSVAQQPSGGVGLVSVDGPKIIFSPSPNWFGETNFTLVATDSYGLSSEEQFYTVKIDNENDAPSVKPVTKTAPEDLKQIHTVEFDDIDGPSPHSVYISNQPSSGGVCSVADRDVVFIPNPDWVGTAVCQVAVSDDGGAVGYANITFKATSVNDAPAAESIHVTLNQGSSTNADVVVIDPDSSESHSVLLLDPVDPAFGVVSVAGKRISLNPVPSFYGFKKVAFKVVDKAGAESAISYVYVKVIPVNSAPVLQPGSFTTGVGVPLEFRIGAIDPNGDSPITYHVTTQVDPSKGAVSVSGDLVTFTPVAGFVGTASASIVARDPGGLQSAPAVYEFNVLDATIVATDPDVPDSHTIVIVQHPPVSSGALAVVGNVIKFTPVAGYFGSTTFKYKVVDSDGAESAVMNGSIEVQKHNYAPTSSSASISVVEGEVSAPVTPSVVDANPYDAGLHKFTVPIQNTNGFVEVVNNKLVYSAAYGFSGVETFKYLAVDQGGLSVVGTATVTVAEKNYSPVSVKGSAVGSEGQPLTAAIVVEDKNPADTFTIDLLEQTQHGSLSLQGDKLTFTPVAGFVGKVIIPVRATDNGGLSVDGYVLFTVEKANHAPQSVTGLIRVPENGRSAAYYPKVSDPNIYDLGKHVISIVVSPGFGTAEIIDNKIVYTPNLHYSGDDLIRVSATDLAGQVVQGDIRVEVEKENTAPQSTSVTIYTREGEASEPTIPTVDDFNTWDSHTFEIVTQPLNGSVLNTPTGFVYTPKAQFYGLDEFKYRAIDSGGEVVEGFATVIVYKFNFAPEAFTPTEVRFYEGVGGVFSLAPVDKNLWGSHEFEVVQQPAHGDVWFNGHSMVYRTTGKDPAQVLVKVTDQAGESFTGPVMLTPRPVSDLIDGMPVVDLPAAEIRTPAITKSFSRADGRPGFVITDPAVLEEIGTELVVVVDDQSEVGLSVGGVNLPPSSGARFVVDYLSPDAIGTSLSAIEEAKAGQAFVKVARIDGAGSVYRIPVVVWAPTADVSFSANPAVQLLDRVRAQVKESSSNCTFAVKESAAIKGNPYDSPICYVEFTKRPAEVRVISSDSTLAFEGPLEAVGLQSVEAAAYIVGADNQKHLVATFDKELEVTSIEGSVAMAPKYPFTEAFFKVEELDIDMKQTVGPACDLTVVDYRAKSAAANFSSRPVCLVEWTELPVGVVARANWDKPYVLGSSQYLGLNALKWNMFIYSPTGAKVAIGPGQFEFTSVMPPEISFDFVSKTNKIGDGLFKSYVSGQYVAEATIISAGAKLKIKHNFNEGKEQEEEVLAGYQKVQETNRRINAAPFDALWETREVAVTASYGLLPDLAASAKITVVSVPDQAILPILDNYNQKLLSTEDLEVTVNIGDAYNTSVPYNSLKMGEWDIRLVTKPTWNDIDPITDWVASDAEGKAAFVLPLDDLAGKTLRVYAEARPKSPIPEYQETRMSPKPLSLAVLNGAALDGSVRSLRMTGEAPLRVTLFADVTNRAWTKDLGAVKWEVSTDGGPWIEEVNKSRTPQRLSKTFMKGVYKVRAELTNKHSGAKSLTDEIEIVAYNVPTGYLKGPGNTFLDAEAEFKVRQPNGAPLDLSNIDVEWSIDRGVTWFAGVDTWSVTKPTEQRVYVYARMKFKDSPTGDPRIWKVMRSGVAFRKVRPPRVQIIGPRRPEVGVEAVWVANMLMPYPNMDLTMGGEFIMPNGGVIVPGQTASYTPTDDDLVLDMTEISYRAWIDGYRDKGGEGLTSQRITFWLYDWPEWAIQPTFSSEYAPADLTLRVRNIGEFKGVEGVFYDWELPAQAGYTTIKDDNMALRILTIEKPETYPFRVHVYDARGNYSLVERSMVFKEPPPWEVNLAWSGNNTAHRAPMEVMVRPYISGGHPKDSITSMVYKLNGDELETGGSRYARAKLPEEGTYAVTLDIESRMGKTVSGGVDIAVKNNIPPTCEIQVVEGGTAWTAKAQCVDVDGRIARHHWYLNDTLQGLGGAVITISKRTYTEPPKIILVAVDDSGEESPAVAW